jgi:hypothetical protein
MTKPAPSLKLLIHTALLACDSAHFRHAWDRDPEDGSFERIVDRALAAEKSGFDGVFFGDAPALLRDTLASNGTFPYEPFTLLSALAARTSRLGLIATIATEYNDPYNLARRTAALDYISGGRAGWNAVTGFLGETNFGFKEIVPPAGTVSAGGGVRRRRAGLDHPAVGSGSSGGGAGGRIRERSGIGGPIRRADLHRRADLRGGA